MRNKLAAIILGGALAAGGIGATVPNKTTKKKGASSARRRAPTAPRQLSPSPERYKEIQESLIAKGYLKGPASGKWGQESMDAMSKFQTDQKLEPTGKVTAKSLISLGLGPQEPGKTIPADPPK